MKRLLSLLFTLSAAAILLSSPGCEPVSGVTLSVSLTESEVSAESTFSDLVIESDSPWRITVSAAGSSASVNWVTSEKASGSGNETVRLTIDENTGDARSADITVAVGSVTRTATLKQAGTTTPDPDPDPVPGWTELPEINTDADKSFITHFTTLEGKAARNYSMLYDQSTYMAYWVAYPMHVGYMGDSGRTGNWAPDPQVPYANQVNYTSGFGSQYYDRGHQVPSADRTASYAMNSQTFYYTNMTPQRWRLNQVKWGNLETLLRKKATDVADTIWVVTGAVLQKAGETETITYLTDRKGTVADPDTHVDIPVPNYYYKVALRRKSDDSYTAVGFWMPNVDTTGAITASDAYTVREIENFTGFNFFANLPQSVQDAAETVVVNADWF